MLIEGTTSEPASTIAASKNPELGPSAKYSILPETKLPRRGLLGNYGLLMY
jgi:hypothetical protein